MHGQFVRWCLDMRPWFFRLGNWTVVDEQQCYMHLSAVTPQRRSDEREPAASARPSPQLVVGRCLGGGEVGDVCQVRRLERCM